MMPLIEMMMKSLDGNGYKQIEQQHGLNASDAEKVLEAILPAFSTGLKRNAAKPKDFGAFMQALSDGRHEKFADDADVAFSDDGVREGNGILKHLFGSKETSRALASQASQASGIDEQTIKKMLPVVANMVMGGLFKQSNQKQSQASAQLTSNNVPANISGGGILGEILGELAKNQMGGSRNNRSSRQRQKDNPLGDILDQMMGGQSRSRSRRPEQTFGSDNPLGEIFENMLGQKRGHYEPEVEQDYQEPRRERNPSSRNRSRDEDYYADQGNFEDIGPADHYEQPRSSRNNRRRDPYLEKNGTGLEDLFGDMFETGRDVDDDYQRGVESIFDKFMKR